MFGMLKAPFIGALFIFIVSRRDFMRRVIEFRNMSYTGKLRVNRDNSRYEIKKGELVKVIRLVDDELDKRYRGVVGVADSSKMDDLGAVFRLVDLDYYNEDWDGKSFVNLRRGDIVRLLDRDNKEIVL